MFVPPFPALVYSQEPIPGCNGSKARKHQDTDRQTKIVVPTDDSGSLGHLSLLSSGVFYLHLLQ